MQPRFDQHLAESVEGGVPVTASPAPAAEVMVLQDFIPPAQSPLASPPLSPYIHPPMGSPPPQPLQYAQPYPYQYPQPYMANFPSAFYPTPFTPPNAPFHYPGEILRAGSAGAEDERARLLEKVSNVLPDIDRLLHVYQESQGLLSEKDNLVKQAEAQHLEETAKMRIELSACKEEYEKIMGEQAGENLRLKGEIAEQREKIKLLQDERHEVTHAHEGLTELKIKCEKLAEEVDIGRSVNEKLLTEKKSRDDELQQLKNQIQKEQAQHEHHQAEKRKLEEALQTLKDQLHDERTRHEREQIEWREAHEKETARREEEHARSLHEHKVGLSKIQLDLAGMITKHTQQKKELDLARATIAEHERSLTEKAKELADTRRLHEAQLENSRRDGEQRAQQYRQEVNKWSKELSQSIAEHEEEISKVRDACKKELEQMRKFAAGRLLDSTTKHEQREAELREELTALRAQVEKLEGDLQAKCLELTNAGKDHEKLQANHELTDKHYAQLAETMLNLRNKQAEWQRESERMDQILQNLRQFAPNNGKSDESL
jgi:chromosome segregation ATPase